MSDLTINEKRAYAAVQAKVRSAVRTGEPSEVREAQAEAEQLRQALYEGDDFE